jgi:signal peptide peptidase SppA
MSKKQNIWSRITSMFKRSKKNIVILNLHGVIGSHNIGLKKPSLSIHALKKDIDKAFETPRLTAVALSINSPGGAPVQAELITKYILKSASKHNVPLYSFVEDVAASGGYWLACCSKEIYASRSSIIGSIGVISSGFGFVDTIKKLGIKRRVITQGKNKSIYDPFLPEKESDKEIIESIQKDIHQEFKDLVEASRKNKLKASADKLFNGEFWSGSKALDMGLIDGIGDVYTIMEERYGKDVKFHLIEKEESWLKKKLGVSSAFDGFIDSFFMKIKERVDFNKFGL